MKAGSSFSRRLSEFCGVTLFAAALIWLIALATYEPTDPAWFFSAGASAAPANFAGRVGAFTAELSFQLFGYASYLIPAIFVIIGWHYFWCRAVDAAYTKIVGVVLMLGCLSSLLSLSFGSVDIAGKSFRTGGYLGEWLALMMSEYLNRIGSIIVILTLLFLSVILSTQFSLGRMFSSVTVVGKSGTSRIAGTLRGWLDGRRRARQRRALLAKQAKKAAPITTVIREASVAAASPVAAPKRPAGALRSVATRIFGKSAGASERTGEKPAAAKPVAAAEPAPADPRRPPVMAKRAKPEAPMLPLPEPEPRQPRRIGAFSVPPLSLLDAPKAERKIDERELMDGARLLEEKCREFAVEGAVAQIHPGPVVTTFEFKPDAGVKYGKITGLADDLCLAMQAESVLIDRIPGKVHGRHSDSEPHARADFAARAAAIGDVPAVSSKLTLALGKTIHGEPYVTDLATMPHLLIAGSTGTGKSVAINSMLSSILFRASPEEVRLIMIDPKRVELGMYEDIPHLMTPVVVDPKQAVNALRWAVKEMEERYKKLAAAGVRNIEQFNRNAAHAAKERSATDESEALQPLAYIVVVIDELADLMMVARSDVEESIARLAQMARAVGHPSPAGHAAAVGGRHHRPHQGEPALAHFVPRAVEDRLANDSRRQRRRAAAGPRRHAVHAAWIIARHPAARAVYLGAGKRAARQLPPQAGEADLQHADHGGGQEARRRRDGEGRSVRRSGAHRGDQRPGVDFLPAAPAAHRVQPRRAAGGHDGNGRPRLAGRRRQGPRGARGQGLLRGSGCAAQVACPRGASPSRC